MRKQPTGNRVAIERAKKGWNQEQLSKAAKVSRPMISNIERGEATPSLKNAYRIAKALDSTIDEIFFGKNVQKMNRNKTA
jgi:putative transcriptional regulator